MRIAVIGGGPGGLYFAALAGAADPTREITLYDRNPPGTTFGFGVVFSDETLGGIEHADERIYRAMAAEFARWDDIDVHRAGTVTTSGGHGFAAMGRVRLLEILRERCLEVGVRVHTGTEAPDVAALAADHDLVVAADGVSSATRARYADTFRPTVDERSCRYIWLGADKVFESFTFWIADTPHGVVQVHAYPYDAHSSTVIVEMGEDVWRGHGFDRADEAASTAGCEELLAPLLDGHRLRGNNSRWIRFGTVRCARWSHGNVVLLGDAAHTAHFSIGSGTKLAMEDALALANQLDTDRPDTDRPAPDPPAPDPPAPDRPATAQPGDDQARDDQASDDRSITRAIEAYETQRRPVVASTQRAAQASLEWFEQIAQYTWQPPTRFAFNILTRSRRVTFDNLKLRDPDFAAAVCAWYAEHEVARGATPGPPVVRPPMFQPFRLGGLELANRVIVSAMDMYSAVDGMPDDFHLVHLGSKALGGAGLVMTEMVCVSPDGRITPGCTGLYTGAQGTAWRRIVDFVHQRSGARIGVQLGHSGRKGSTRLMWDGIDEPLPDGNWQVVGPSPVPYSARSQVPHELSIPELAGIREQFVSAAIRAARAGFDVLELHCAHGYLLSSFISPLTNRRTDRYGGPLADRLRYPLEVFDAVRAVWPAERPMTVRISATDWAEGGIDADDAVAVARAFAEHGAAAIDVSTGQVVSDEAPAYGRSYQTPYADRISNEVARHTGTAVIAVGAISSYDDVNSILLAGRADLCALGRTHLYDPQWTLHAAAEQDWPGVEWPVQFRAGSRKPHSA